MTVMNREPRPADREVLIGLIERVTYQNTERHQAHGMPKRLEFACPRADGRSRDEVLGPPLCRIYERSAVGPLPSNAPAPPSLGVFARRASKIFGWWALGLGRPSPLFDDRTDAPRAVPRVLTRSERAGLVKL
jgi:hypothetical protein